MADGINSYDMTYETREFFSNIIQNIESVINFIVNLIK